VDNKAATYHSLSSYHFVGNSPLKNREVNGEFFLGTLLTGAIDFVATAFFKGGLDFTSREARSEAWRQFDPSANWSKTNKALEIDKGLFQTDPKRSWVGMTLQFLSRFTWEAPQTALGFFTGHARNITEIGGYVDYVGSYGGATVISSGDINRPGGAFTLGSFINGTSLRADPTDELFRHEYGHTIQSQYMGLFYLRVVGLPSLIGSGLQSLNRNIFNHDAEWYETWANQLGRNYFEKHEGGILNDPTNLNFTPWRNFIYPTQFNRGNASFWYSIFGSLLF
jgi:hypothetical protein